MRCKLLVLTVTFLAFVLVGVLVAATVGDVNMASGKPDWVRAIALIGQDPDGNLILIQVDADGQLTVPFKGENPDADLVNVAVDADGQLYAIMRGAAGEDLLVDSDGFLSAILKGEKDDTSLANIAIDDDGQLIIVPRGAAGNYMAVDANGNLATVIKGLEGANLRTIAVDASGNLIAVMKGLEGANLRSIAVDASGRIIMVPYGTTQVAGTATVTQTDSIREVQGAEGANLRTLAVDASGQIIMVPRGQSGHYMAVDSDGYITAVLKGLFGATLKTMAVDEDGRIYGYQVDDLDQWGETLLVGNAEQAARLGSPVSWDRRGQVQAVFDFGNGFHGVRRVTAGTGSAIALSPSVWQHGGYSVKLTGASDGNFWAYIGAYMAVPPSDTFGCAINWSAEPTPAYLEMRLEIVIENSSHSCRIRYDFANEKLQYRDTGASWQDIGTKDLEVQNFIWHRMKVVVNVDTNVFVRALLNNTQYDMSAAVTTSAAPTSGDYASCEVYVVSNSGDNDIAYIDTLIFTVEE